MLAAERIAEAVRLPLTVSLLFTTGELLEGLRFFVGELGGDTDALFLPMASTDSHEAAHDLKGTQIQQVRPKWLRSAWLGFA